MNPEAQRRLRRAEQLLRLASQLIDLDYPADSVSRSYYAAFHSASAVLLQLGIARSSHHGVWAAFGQFVTASGRIDPKQHRAGLALFRARSLSDYLSEPEDTRAEAEAALEMAREFVGACRSFLAGQ